MVRAARTRLLPWLRRDSKYLQRPIGACSATLAGSGLDDFNPSAECGRPRLGNAA